MKINQAYKTVGVGMFLVIIILFIIRYLYINNLYPNPLIKASYIGEPLNFDGNEYCLEKIEWHDGSVITDIIPKYIFLYDAEGNPYPTQNIRVMLAYITISNVLEDNSTYVDLTRIEFESGAWSNQFSFELLQTLNKSLDALELNLNAKESKEIILPITMYDFQFDPKIWKEIENRKFHIVLNCYPEKCILVSVKPY